MTRQVSVAELRAYLADLLGTVHYGKEPVVIERKGKPFAVVISPEQYEQFQQQAKERFFKAVDEVQRLNADEDPDAVLRYVTDLVERVRQERCGREHGPDSSDR